MDFELPTKGSIVYRHQKGDSKFRFFTKIMNSTLIFFYRIKLLPIFGIGKHIIVITTIGRKTTKIRRKPVLYKYFNTKKMTLYSARGKNSDWLKNILAIKDHIIQINKGFRKLKVKAILISSEEEKYEHLVYWFENYADAKTIFGYDKIKHKNIINSEAIKKLVNKIEFIQLIPV